VYLRAVEGKYSCTFTIHCRRIYGTDHRMGSRGPGKK
jgi:hypothetical protein